MTTAQRNSGMTLVEMMIAMGLTVFVLAAIMTASVSMQRSLAAATAFASAKGDQIRIGDYLARDTRSAAGASAQDSTTSGDPAGVTITTTISAKSGNTTVTTKVPNVLTLTIPDYYDTFGSPRNPTIVNGVVTYGPSPKTIRYFQIGSSFYREEAGVASAIATSVGSFTITPQDLTSKVTCSITFPPTFTFQPSSTALSGTTIYASTFLRNAGARQ